MLAASALIVRATAVAQPLGIDQGLWASAVRGMARGQLLYRDVWEQRPPGIYWMYLAAFRVLGWDASSVAWLDLAAAAVTTLLIFLVARALADRLTGACAAALYAVFTVPAWLYGYGGFLERAVSETFIVVCVCAMAWLAVRWRQRPSTQTALLLGAFAGATLIFKPNAGLYFPALLLWIALFPRAESEPRRIDASAVAAACAAALVVPALTLLWLWRHDVLNDAKVAVIDFNRHYVAEGFDVLAYAVLFSKAVWLRIKTEPLWLAGAAGAVAAILALVRRRPLPPLVGLAVIWGGTAACVIVVNGARLFNSYFINALPPLALLGAAFLCQPAGHSRVRRMAIAVVAILMAIMVVQRDYAGRVFGTAAKDLAALAGRTPRVTYLEQFGRYNRRSGYSARANHELAEYVRAHTSFDDRIFLFSINGAGVYFEADRLSAHRFLRVNFFAGTDFPHPDFRLESVADVLRSRRPAYLIFERLHSTADPRVAAAADTLPEHPALAGLLQDYVFDTRIEDFSLYRRQR